MSSLIVWDVENVSDDNQSNFERISDWWGHLKDQKVKHRTFSGSRNGASFEREDPSLTICDPRLANNTLSYNNCDMPVKKLELNLQKRSLEVHTLNSPTIHFFEAGITSTQY